MRYPFRLLLAGLTRRSASTSAATQLGAVSANLHKLGITARISGMGEAELGQLRDRLNLNRANAYRLDLDPTLRPFCEQHPDVPTATLNAATQKIQVCAYLVVDLPPPWGKSTRKTAQP